jgi:pyruvate kinase
VRRTKILATLGPATRTPAQIGRLLSAGVDAFRVNFSHGTDAEHRTTFRQVRAVAANRRREVAIVADLQGPKIRIGELATPTMRLRPGAEWTLDSTGRTGDERRVSATIPDIEGAGRAGDRILVGDGSVELRVVRRERGRLVTRVIHGGIVRPHAGLSLPNAHLRTELLGPKDRSDLTIALREGADFVALSFVRNGQDVRGARDRIDRAGFRDVGVIAKIERPEALGEFGRILDEADGIMVARGDLGIAVPLERLALEQKRLVSEANARHRPVIVATQVLLSMVTSPRPTRAEATDVANAVLDGADAIMLSEESAIGAYPAEAVRWLDRICRTTESAASRGEVELHRPAERDEGIDPLVARGAVDLAEALSAAAIVVPTHSGRTARLVAARRPRSPVLALSTLGSTRRKLSLTWGVEALSVPRHLNLVRLSEEARRIVRARPGIGRSGPIVLTAGYPVEGRPTNLVTVIPRTTT